jgi:hypothetical protein
VLPLGDLRALVTVPDFEPFDATSQHDGTGTDSVQDTADCVAIGLAWRGRLVLLLLPGKLQPDLEDTARRMIARSCRHQILATKHALNDVLWTGLKALQVGACYWRAASYSRP